MLITFAGDWYILSKVLLELKGAIKCIGRSRSLSTLYEEILGTTYRFHLISRISLSDEISGQYSPPTSLLSRMVLHKFSSDKNLVKILFFGISDFKLDYYYY